MITQENKSWINKNKTYIAIGILLFVLFFFARNCVNNQAHELSGENKALTEQVKQLKDKAKIAETEFNSKKDSVLQENKKKELKIKDLSEKVLQSEKKVVILQEQNKKDKVRVTKLAYVDVAKEVNSIYNTQNAKATDVSVNLEKDLPNLVLETIIGANSCQDIVKEKDIQLKTKDSVLLVKDGQVRDGSVLLFFAEKQIKQQKELNTAQETLNSGQKKEIRKLKQKNFFNKVLIPVALGIGIYSGIQIAK